MTYTTQDYSATRVTPKHELSLPLSKVGMDAKYPLPAIAEGKVYLVNVGKSISVLDDHDLSIQISNEILEPIKGVTVMSESIFIENDDGKAYLLDSESLEVKRELPNGICFDKSSTCIDGIFYALRKKGDGILAPTVLAALSCEDSQVLWEFDSQGNMFGFAVSNNHIICADFEGSLYCLAASTGKVIWDKSVADLGVLTTEELESSGGLMLSDYPRIHDGTVSIAYIFNYVIGLDVHSGDLKWKHKFEDGVPYTTVTESGLLYVYMPHNRSHGSMIRIICSNSGSVQKEIQVKNNADHTECHHGIMYTDVTDSHFWTQSYQGLTAINFQTGHIDWEYELKDPATDNPFFVSNGRLYVATRNELSVFQSKV